MVRVHSASPVCGLKRLLKSQKQPASPASNPRPAVSGAPIERLPVHILYDIGRRADTRDILHLTLCSHQLRTALLPLLYSTVELSTNKHCKTTLLALSRNPDVTQHIRRLIVRPNTLQWTEPGDEVDEDGIASLLAAMAGHLRALEAFEWDGIEMPHDNLWLALRKSCRSLRRISTSIGEASLSASSPLWDFSDLRQVALNVKCHSLDWLAEGLPKTEKLPRKFWAMLLERCPRLEELTIGGCAPSPRIFDVRHVTAGRWPRLRSITLGGMVLLASDHHARKDEAAFQNFFALHTSLRSITLQHAEGSASVPSAFVLPHGALPRLEAFGGPLRLARSLPPSTRHRTLRRLTLTALHHSASAFPPTCAVLQEEFGALRELSVWVDLSFGQQASSAAASASAAMRSRSSVERDRMRAEKGGRPAAAFDDMLMVRALLAACPRLTHLDLACFTRPTFSYREFSRVLQTSAPQLESFTLTKMQKSSEEDMTAKGAVRLAADNPRLRRFTLCTTLDAWLNPTAGRVKQMGVYEVMPPSCAVAPPLAASSESPSSGSSANASRESIMSAPASISAYAHGSASSSSAFAGPSATTATLLAHEYGQRNITGRMYARHLVVPVAPKERPLSLRDSAPPSSFPMNMAHNMVNANNANLSRVGSRTSTVNSHSHSQSRGDQSYAGSLAGHSEESHEFGSGHQQQVQFQTPPHQQAVQAQYTNTTNKNNNNSTAGGHHHHRAASSASGTSARSRRSSISNVVGSIAYALVGMKHHSASGAGAGARRSVGAASSSHGSTTSGGTGTSYSGTSVSGGSSVSRSGSGSSGGDSSSGGGGGGVGVGSGSGGLSGGEIVRASPEDYGGRKSASTEDGFILV